MEHQEKIQKIRFNMMKDTLGMLKKGSKEYWEQRCIQLEISLDPTYPAITRSNARELYMILVKQ